MTVGLVDVMATPLRKRAPVTTAHHELARFYRKAFRSNHPRRSIVEAIAAAPSVFSVEGLVKDFQLLYREASPKTRASVEETARVRLCTLRGGLP